MTLNLKYVKQSTHAHVQTTARIKLFKQMNTHVSCLRMVMPHT